MAYTVYEYQAHRDGQPVEPAKVRTASKALGAAHALAAGTRYVVVVPDADMYLRISAAGTAATSADYKLAAGDARGFPVDTGLSLYGLSAA